MKRKILGVVLLLPLAGIIVASVVVQVGWLWAIAVFGVTALVCALTILGVKFLSEPKDKYK